MNIKPEVQTVDMLFRTVPQQYKIPIYQRRYVWGISNWRSLWSNIEDIFDTNQDLFAGIIVTHPSITQNDLEIYDVIDGQQRLTTLQIILCVIRDICELRGNANIVNDANRLLRNDTEDNRIVEAIGSDARYKLLPKKGSDEDAFRLLVDSPQHCGEIHGIHRAYYHFRDEIEKYDSDKIAELFFRVFTLQINVAQINLSEDDISEEIFASLNATGRMLSEFDYLRNNLFLRAGTDGDDLYNNYWLESFERDDDLNLDEFLHNFLKANLVQDRTESELKPFDVYQTQYRRELKQGGNSKYVHLSTLPMGVKSEFIQLTAYAKSYRELNGEMKNPDSDIGHFVQFCKDRKFPDLDPFLLFVKHRFGEEIDDVCQILESYIVRRMLCYDNYVKTNRDSYETIELIFFEAIVKGKFRAGFLAKLLYETEGWPEDNYVQDAFREAKSKDHDFIVYLFRQMQNWLKKQISYLGGPDTALDLQNQLVLLGEIESYIVEIQRDPNALDRLQERFNELWAPPHFFLTNELC